MDLPQVLWGGKYALGLVAILDSEDEGLALGARYGAGLPVEAHRGHAMVDARVEEDVNFLAHFELLELMGDGRETP
jgi:hypothetical protein